MSQCQIVSTDILLEFLEVAFHGILYYRKIYPSEIFRKKKLYGTGIWICEHPEVKEYLKNILNAVREALTADITSIKSVNLIITDNQGILLEKFAFDLLKIQFDAKESDPYFLKTEESLRTLCLKFSMLDSYLKPLPEDSIFSIELDTHEAALVSLSENPKCEDFPWIIRTDNSIETSGRTSLLPLYTVRTDHLALQLFVIGDTKV
ncbi:mitotic spindle assembly checkpoint protein MAD2B isoform X2 [Fopius arisanus]|uniref:Mitotic spindle assembly checkpoint protein MAD2B isoform X2 n=1 Tax=Fopius arisanus TaxID=64838 RepID=A0A9R1T9Y0_9HYME|nr:PREDICTED: mitotic spindle assembly checkpoint protein MAD2B isoform X2 [Fopius arisanus]